MVSEITPSLPIVQYEYIRRKNKGLVDLSTQKSRALGTSNSRGTSMNTVSLKRQLFIFSPLPPAKLPILPGVGCLDYVPTPRGLQGTCATQFRSSKANPLLCWNAHNIKNLFYLKHLKPTIHKNIIYKFSSYLTGNTLRLRYKAQPINAV
jgi:hypothetical protein